MSIGTGVLATTGLGACRSAEIHQPVVQLLEADRRFD